MIGWVLAESSAPNWVWLALLFVAFVGLVSMTYSRSRLEKSTKKWMEVYDMYLKIIGHEYPEASDSDRSKAKEDKKNG